MYDFVKKTLVLLMVVINAYILNHLKRTIPLEVYALRRVQVMTLFCLGSVLQLLSHYLFIQFHMMIMFSEICNSSTVLLFFSPKKLHFFNQSIFCAVILFSVSNFLNEQFCQVCFISFFNTGQTAIK